MDAGCGQFACMVGWTSDDAAALRRSGGPIIALSRRRGVCLPSRPVPRPSTCLLWLCWLPLIAPASAARAETLAISIHVDPCVPVEHAKLQRLLAIELGTAQIRASGAPTSVAVACVAQGIELRLDDAVTRKSMQRVLPASSFRDASSTRLLALVVAEFVVASWIELSVRVDGIEAASTAGDTELRRAAQQAASRHMVPPVDLDLRESSLSAALSGQLWPGSGGLLLGGGVRWLRAVATHWALTSAADLAVAQERISAGSIDVVTGSLAFALAVHTRLNRFELYTGLGARVGLASLQGRSADDALRGYHFSALYGGPLWWNRIAYRAGPHFRVGLEIEAGLTTLPVTATAPSAGGTMDAAPVEAFALEGASLSSGLYFGMTL
jgi:hypothetical protein